MIKVTDDVREAARRLLAKHNEEEPHRVEARFRERVLHAKSWCPPGKVVNEAYIRKEVEREGEARADKDKRKLLEAIVDGRRKLIDGRWWIEVHGDADRSKMEKMAAMADPLRNSNEHEREVAARKLAKEKAKRPPGVPPPPPPLPETIVDLRKRRKGRPRPPSPQASRKLSDSVASHEASSDSVAPPVKPKPESVATPKVEHTHASDSVVTPKNPNARRALKRAMARADLKCQACGKPLSAQRPTARYCNVTCRSRAWRKPSA